LKLQSITYMSTAVIAPSREQVIWLLDKARARNEREGVTGVLLYAGGAFLQYLEGPEEGLTRVYGAIVRDPTHHQIFEMIREPVARREFSQWTMGYRGTVPVDEEEDEALRKLLEPGNLEQSQGRLLLNAFWTNRIERAR
jgi:hypothetical protein